MNILNYSVFLFCCFGQWSVSLRVYGFSISSLYVVGLILTCFVLMSRVRSLVLPNGRIFLYFTVFVIYAAAWALVIYLDESYSDSSVLVWFACYSLMINIYSQPGMATEAVLELKKSFTAFLYFYILVLGVTILLKDEDPATTQVGIAFVAFCISSYFHESKSKWIFLSVTIFVGQVLLKARGVVLAELLMILILSLVFNLSRRGVYTGFLYFLVQLLLLISASVIIFSYSGLGEKSIEGGDQALEFAGYSLNTSGRIYQWGVMIDSISESLFVGHGIPVAKQMMNVPGWFHPHNDYLRLLHQLGLIGLSAWLLFIIKSGWLIVRIFRASVDPVISVISLAALGTVCGQSLIMFTDNTMVYPYVIFLLFLQLGVLLRYHKEWGGRGKGSFMGAYKN